MYQITTAFQKINELEQRIRAVTGGTSASKTISILIWLIAYAQTFPDEIISVTSESFPHLKRGAIRDFLNIMEAQHYFKDDLWNKTDSVYHFETGSIIEFFGVESWEKVKGARRDVLFVNEANHVTYNAFTQMEVRTKKLIFLDWNPESEYWFYEEVQNRPDVDFITLTYRDNEALDSAIVQAIESRRNNKAWFRVYGDGLLGEVESRIYTGWNIIDELPPEARLVRYGLDFGYSNDPTAIVAQYSYNGGIIFKEMAYAIRMDNQQIGDLFLNMERALIVADSAEPKSIDEIKKKGLMIVPTFKGKDTVRNGIQFLQTQAVSVTKDSLNLIKEYRNYLWMTDRDGKVINEPSPILNHLMDACRYSATNKVGAAVWRPADPGGVKSYIPGTII